MVDVIFLMKEYSCFFKGIFFWVGFKIKYLEYKNVEWVVGIIDWLIWKLFKYVMDGIVDFL